MWLDSVAHLDDTDWFPGQVVAGIDEECEPQDEYPIPAIYNYKKI